MDNKGIANVFEEMGNILDIKGADFFRVNAYRKAALIVGNLAVDLRQMVDKSPQDIDKIPGIGKALKQKIIELVQSGKCSEHEEMKKGFPAGLLEMMNLRGVGPKKVKLFYSQLKITTLKQLQEAAEKHKVRELEGMGPKSEEEILKAIKEYSGLAVSRHLIIEALQEAENYIKYLKQCGEIRQIEYAGSLRRFQETIGDIDILVTVKDPKKSRETVIKHFTNYGEVINVVAVGDTRSAVVLESRIQVDLRVVADECFGAALHYFTGSKEHNVRIRDLAKKKGLKVNEYGVFRGKKMIAGKKEEEIFKAVGLPFIIPELRKNDGEIEYGLKNRKLPKFVELEDIRGDLHSHTTFSDGKNSLLEMAGGFMARGYEYFAVTDHSSLVKVAGGMGSKEIRAQWQEIEELNKKLSGKIRILKGCEVDILKDGSLDFSDEILKELDVVIISAHLFNRLPAEEQTKRLIAAIENPYSMIMAHPTGRRLNKRAEMEFDMEKIMKACVQNRVALEINSNPERLDLTDKYVRMGKSKGIKFVIDTDAHSIGNQEFMKFGVGMARRGWLTKRDVLNAGNITEFESYFQT